MTYLQFLEFGRMLHYPALLLGNGQLLHAGRDEWFRFVHVASRERLDKAIARAEVIEKKMRMHLERNYK